MAKIREQDIDALRERADLVEVVSAYSRLKKAGTHTFKGLCPLHSEKTPSFTVDSAKGLWHCFGCGQGGNVYHFIQKVENLPFRESVEWLARRNGFDLQYEEMRPGETKRAGVKARLIELNELAGAFFHDQLMTSRAGEPARNYLAGRGFGRDVAERWRLGYAPGRDQLCRYVMSKGFSSAEIEQGDFGRRSERDGSLYDTFRARITFPTWNLQGDLVGFGARALGDVQPKYLNTAETPVFSKSRVMYGLDRAKSTIARGVAVVVEGYTDVIALHEAGVKEAVATNGVALGESHFELLRKFSQRVVLMLDQDEAGRGATERSFDIQHRIGLEVLVAPLPLARDPADVVTEDGVDGIRKAIEAARPLLDFKLEQALAKLPLDTPEARSRAVTEAAKVLSLHPDPIARHEYVFAAAERIGVEPEGVQRALSEQSREVGGRTGGGTDKVADRRLPGHVKVEREALALLLMEAKDATPWTGRIDETYFTSPARREVFGAAKIISTDGGGAGSGAIAAELSSSAVELFTELSVGAATSAGYYPRDRIEEVFVRLQIFKLEREIKARRSVLQGVNPVSEPERHDALFTELVGLEADRRDLLRNIQGAA